MLVRLKVGWRTPSAVIAAAILSLLLLCPSASLAELIEERDFRLTKNGRDHIVFSVAKAGTLVIGVRIKQPFAKAPIQLLLEGPGGLRVEKEGAAPLRLRYTVAASSTGNTWRASVINASRLPDVTGRLKVEIQPPAQGRSLPPSAAGVSTGAAAPDAEPGFTDGKVTIVDDRRLRAVCRDRNLDVSVRLDLEQGKGELLMRFNPVFSLTVRQLSGDRIELRNNGQAPLYLDLAKKAIFFANAQDGAFCRVRIYRQGED